MKHARAALALLATLVTGVIPAAAPETPPDLQAEGPETGRGKDYPGWAALRQLQDLTVVYPGGPGEDLATNRRSAELRARFLETQYGTRVRVIADVDATTADRRSNLLLLGWTNRLLGTDAAPRPFHREAGTLSFLDLVEPGGGLDLLLFAPSPYDPERLLFFWSRIDPELDRAMVLPMSGSDWALLSGFRVVRQGMFKPGKTWPPVREPDAEMDHRPKIEEAQADWTHHRSAHYDVFFSPAVVEQAELEAIVRAREAAFERAAAALGAPPAGYRIALSIYADAEQKQLCTGIADPAHAMPRTRELHMVRPAARAASEHEEVHLLARALLGVTESTSLYEGLALAREGRYADAPLEVHAALMLEHGAVPSLTRLLDEVDARALPPAQRLVGSALLVRWVEATAGRTALARLYRAPATGATAIAALGADAAATESAFRAWLTQLAASRRSDVEFVRAQSDAAERHRAGDYPGLIAALERALRHKPADPQTIFNLASARMRTGDFPGAERDLRALLALDLRGADSTFVIFGHYQLGRLFDVQGRRAEALEQYRRVLELPDQKDAHRVAREAIETPVRPEQLQ